MDNKEDKIKKTAAKTVANNTIKRKKQPLQEFEIEFQPNQIGKVNSEGAIVTNPVFWEMALQKNTRMHFFNLCKLIDPDTGMIALRFSDGRISPLSDAQIAVHFGTHTVKGAIAELVAYGVLAQISVARTNVYVANPYVLNINNKANAYLQAIFNKTTLKRADKYNRFFNKENTEKFEAVWEEGELEKEFDFDEEEFEEEY
ncbi:MAG: hypothetical protein M0R38_10970 [Bacteroidia bacterium]|nr:hypothetical protein [Bacteroidia bacterium]